MSPPKLFRKIAGQAVRLFSKVSQNAPQILNKVSDVSGQIGKGLNAAAPVVGSIGLATGQPELVALAGGMKAGAVGANQLSKTSGQLSHVVDKNTDPLQRARIGTQVGQKIIYG
jgi:hypothetical protein